MNLILFILDLWTSPNIKTDKEVLLYKKDFDIYFILLNLREDRNKLQYILNSLFL